ncbi:hypothetical protein LZ009_13830 [Ramlibacter sp. XY19]|uniref:hypothetical protein n=1 Tax=Ramlibacter paludis TaxID=2908000 RepID=UPI0023DB6881|nr:hypothetical protein [Ramlibacter paludis]MCG2593859.1 hypothetical protein [Ramlibacter paludis]
MSQDRYEGRPLLRLLDCYILDTIGELPPAQRETLEKIEPQLQEAFGSTGGWRSIVEEQMGLLPSVALGMETLWAAFQQDEERLGNQAKSSDFVRAFVDQNFPGLLDDEDADQDSPGGGST